MLKNLKYSLAGAAALCAVALSSGSALAMPNGLPSDAFPSNVENGGGYVGRFVVGGGQTITVFTVRDHFGDHDACFGDHAGACAATRAGGSTGCIAKLPTFLVGNLSPASRGFFLPGRNAPAGSCP